MEPTPNDRIEFLKLDGANDIERFKAESTVILRNLDADILGDVRDKVYTRDLFRRN